MAVVEINLVSGYIPEKADLKRIVGYGTGLIKRYEVDGSLVIITLLRVVHCTINIKSLYQSYIYHALSITKYTSIIEVLLPTMRTMAIPKAYIN